MLQQLCAAAYFCAIVMNDQMDFFDEIDNVMIVDEWQIRNTPEKPWNRDRLRECFGKSAYSALCPAGNIRNNVCIVQQLKRR